MPKDNSRAVYSLWLMPEAPKAVWLNGLIAAAAPTFGTSPFCAHVTVQGDLTLPEETLYRVAETLASSCPAFDWPTIRIACSPHFFRSLFIALQSNDAFDRLRSMAARLTTTEHGLSPFPHLSLAYGEPENAESKGVVLAEFAARLHEIPTVRFDTLALAYSSKDLPIADWRVLENFPLSLRKCSS